MIHRQSKFQRKYTAQLYVCQVVCMLTVDDFLNFSLIQAGGGEAH